jgi:hypothetical protein
LLATPCRVAFKVSKSFNSVTSGGGKEGSMAKLHHLESHDTQKLTGANDFRLIDVLPRMMSG